MGFEDYLNKRQTAHFVFLRRVRSEFRAALLHGRLRIENLLNRLVDLALQLISLSDKRFVLCRYPLQLRLGGVERALGIAHFVGIGVQRRKRQAANSEHTRKQHGRYVRENLDTNPFIAMIRR